MRISVVFLPETAWPEDQARWRAAEDLGFDGGWLLDHLAWRTQADSTWFATVPVLTAAILATSQLRVGPLVTTPNFRHPVPLAKDLMTLDVMSAGRLIVGLGAGAPGYDATVLGSDVLAPHARVDRFAEFVSLLDQLLTRPTTSFAGRWFSAVEARNVPGPVQRPRPPFIVAADGPRSMRIASTAQGWVTMGRADRAAADDEWWNGLAAAARTFDAVAADAALDSGFARVANLSHRLERMTSAAQFTDDVHRAAELGFTEVITAWPRVEPPFRCDRRLFERIAAEMHA